VIVADIRQALRSLRKMPLLAAVVVVSLGAGIGVNTTVFSWVQAMVLHPLPGVPDASRFHAIEPRAETGTFPGGSWLEFRDLQERLRSVADPLAFRMVAFNVGVPGQIERTYGLLVSGNYFSSLGLTPAFGRFLRPDEAARPGGEPVVVISHDYWQSRFAGSPAAIGQTLRVNDRMLTIIGVTPQRFQGTVLSLSFDLFVPATMAPTLLAGSRELEDRSLRGYTMLAKLQPNASREAAQAELSAAMQELARVYPTTNGTIQAQLLRFWDAPRGPQRMLASGLFLLQGILLLLLLTVCGNTANLMLARVSARQREIGVRFALGASRWQVMRLLLIESLMLGFAGALLGAAFAVWGTTALRAVPFIGAFPIKFQTSLDFVGLAFTMLLGVVCGLLFGAGPAIQLARVDPLMAIRTGVQTAARSRLRNGLMGLQVAMALVVLMAAGLFVRSFNETRDIDPGFRREGVLLGAYDLSNRNLDAAAARTFATRLLRRLKELPSVESAAIASSVPLDIHGLPLRAFSVEGRPRDDNNPDRALSNVVTPGYFETMGIPMVAGRDFADFEDSNTPPQAIVNQEFVRRFASGVEAIGRTVQTRGNTYAIAGVVRNSISESFGEPPTPVIYLSYRDRPSLAGEVHLRTRAGAETLLAPELQRIVRDLDPSLPVYDIRTLGDHIEKNLFLRRIPARMFVVLGPLLLVLAAIGIYAVVDFSVSRRTTEIGVRLALGATAGNVMSQIVSESMFVVASGAIAGWAVAFLVDLHLLRGVIYLSIFVGVPAVLMAVAAVACWVPARRATSVDPLIALRTE
jgi:putative ABC transport system permease protein